MVQCLVTRMCVIPYRAKFLRHLYFVDCNAWPLIKSISLHNVRRMAASLVLVKWEVRPGIEAKWLHAYTGSHAFKSLHVIADNSN